MACTRRIHQLNRSAFFLRRRPWASLIQGTPELGQFSPRRQTVILMVIAHPPLHGLQSTNRRHLVSQSAPTTDRHLRLLEVVNSLPAFPTSMAMERPSTEPLAPVGYVNDGACKPSPLKARQQSDSPSIMPHKHYPDGDGTSDVPLEAQPGWHPGLIRSLCPNLSLIAGHQENARR